MPKKTKRDRKPYFVVAFGVCLYVLLMHVGVIYTFAKNFLSLSLPIVVGFILAFVLNVPMTMFERLLGKNKHFAKLKKPAQHKICLSITIVIIALIAYLIIELLVPQITKSAVSLYNAVNSRMPQVIKFLDDNGVNTESLKEMLKKFDLSTLTSASNVVSVIFGFASDVLNIFVTIFIAVVIAIYSLVDKDHLKLSSKKLVYAHMTKEWGDLLCDIGYRIKTTYFNFFSGQCIEACILGVFMYVALLIFQIPYAALIALLTAVFAFIPYVGAFLACGVGVVLILVIDPMKAIVCAVVYETVQLIENHVIYPHVVGNSVGLSALWTLIAVVIGGSMFGVVGMIFFIPLMSVVVELVTESTDKKLAEKNIVVTIGDHEAAEEASREAEKEESNPETEPEDEDEENN